MNTTDKEKIIGMLESIGEYEEITFKLNEKKRLKWVRKWTKGGEIDLHDDRNEV